VPTAPLESALRAAVRRIGRDQQVRGDELRWLPGLVEDVGGAGVLVTTRQR
jgi:hypothetical protein